MWAFKSFDKILLEGPNGIGKTRTIRNIYNYFLDKNVNMSGFVTGDFKMWELEE